MPERIRPMLCTFVKEPVYNEELLYEVKWDGYRIIAFKTKSKVRLDSRSGLDYTSKYPPVVAALKALDADVVIDGEIIAFNEEGKPDFNTVQNYNGHNDPIAYYAFDLLWIDGYDISELPLIERKQILSSVIKDNPVIKFSDSFDDGEALFKQVQELELEGIVAKEKHSSYIQNERGRRWLKIPAMKRQEFVIGGWAESDRNRSFRSLLFGAYNSSGELEWIGRSGGGYKEKEMPGILKKLKSLETNKSPFVNAVLDTKGAVIHYVKPELVANFSFATWTNTGRIRKPATFLGFRNDKKARDVVREIAQEPEKIEKEIAKDAGKLENKKSSRASSKSTRNNWPKIPRPVNQADFKIEDCTVKLNDIEREIWKGITKADLIQYYQSVAPYILPYIKQRPQSLHIKPVNVSTQGFYIKDMEGHEPECADIFTDKRKHKKTGKRDIIDYLVCNNEATLLYMVNLGCIDINPWTSTTDHPNEPDYIVIDLDPSDDDFQKAVKTAIAAKKYFDKRKLHAFVKTSGKTGIHLLLPCSGFNFPEARTIAETICSDIHELVPQFTTTSVSVSSRGDKLYIDPNQNDYADTIACHFSARPNVIPTVSTPLDWAELNSKLDSKAFTIHTITKEIKKRANLHKDLFTEKIKKGNAKILASLMDHR